MQFFFCSLFLSDLSFNNGVCDSIPCVLGSPRVRIAIRLYRLDSEVRFVSFWLVTNLLLIHPFKTYNLIYLFSILYYSLKLQLFLISWQIMTTYIKLVYIIVNICCHIFVAIGHLKKRHHKTYGFRRNHIYIGCSCNVVLFSILNCIYRLWNTIWLNK